MTVAAFVLPLLLLTTAQDKKAPTTPNAIPANAVKIDDRTYKVTEKDGKTWVYRRTPFGLSRLTEEQFLKQQAPEEVKPQSQLTVRVTDLGEEYRFERVSAFGKQVWKKKKSELTADEKTYVEQQASKPSAATAATGAPEKKN
jgi:hypothetical protein